MVKLLQFKLLVFLICIGVSDVIVAQEVTGTVSDHSGALPGVSVIVKGTSVGITTDFDGKYDINASDGQTLVFSYVGYDTQEIVVSGQTIDVVLKAGVALDAVVLTGNRAKPRTILDSPVPIDNIDVAELQNSGKPTFDRMLVFKVPSFNSQNQAISDATAHYDPADLRGLGPSRTLVLVNGKRKNQSAQVYLGGSPGKGEVGVDLKSIPTAAIERVEVLRDGASAQYGSDAVAGVLNIILKKDVEYSTFTSRAGITSENDGFNFSADFNSSLKFGDGGVINFTLGYYKQQITNRAGFVDPLTEGATRDYEIDWLEDNPDAGMTVGQPEMEKGDLFVNLEHPLGENGTIYSFHGFTSRTGKSFAFYRAPYWRSDVADAEFLTSTTDFKGYQPTFEAKINDHINVLGVKYSLSDKWNMDTSVTYGSNDIDVTVNNSVNRDYLADHGTSPTSFNPGGYKFSNLIGNLDISGLVSEKISIATGLEIKREVFSAFEGDPFSYYGGGSDSFAGIKPEEAGVWDRSNFAAYGQVDYDISESLLLGVAARYENFSDGGDNVSWKINGRYKIGKKGAIRVSYSTGFRAPTLHQRHITLSQYTIVDGSTEPVLQGTLANDNPAVQALGVPSLFAETSENIAGGFTYKINKNFSASLDFYQIKVYDRVLFSSQISYDDDDSTTNEIEQILQDYNVVGVQFFINAGDTKTKGADLVLNYRNIGIGNALLNVSLAGNLNTTTIDNIETPAALANAGYDIFDRAEQGLITSSRPKSKFILGLALDVDKWDFSLNNTLFGEVTIISDNDNQNPIYDQTLSSKLTTDFGFVFNLNNMISFNGNVNNIFNVYPDKTNVNTGTTSNGRFVYASSVQQQGQLGTNFSVGINFKL
ncbi:TonB-dependent receptor [Formosa sp. L2A11]|uniref:TonB-dependent receptor n=1 Tax=Formosa sp. L2A11 TaxID=2686363 RepID=UPI00131DA2E1|nr:TonB-dependent receptor [Formosa sp. L2A11]